MTKNEQEKIPEIQVCLQKARDSIAVRNARFLRKDEDGEYPNCPNIDTYLSDVEAIIKDLEIQLKGAFFIWVKQRGENKPITQLDSETLLVFLESTMYESTTYKNIGKQLDKHFFSPYMELPRAEDFDD